MSFAKEIMGCSIIEKTSFASSSKVFLNHNFQKRQGQFCVRPVLVPLERRVVRGTVAAISEDLVLKSVPSVPAEKPVKFKVRAVVTVRNKNKEDLKESLVKQLDAFTDKIGRNVVLELVSTEIDPSKPIFSFGVCQK